MDKLLWMINNNMDNIRIGWLVFSYRAEDKVVEAHNSFTGRIDFRIEQVEPMLQTEYTKLCEDSMKMYLEEV